MSAHTETGPANAEPLALNELTNHAYEVRLVLARMKHAADHLKKLRVATHIAAGIEHISNAIEILDHENA